MGPESSNRPSGTEGKGSVARAEVNGTVAVLAKLVILLGWMVQGSRASTVGRGTGLEVSFPWELYIVGALALVASIALWEAVKWILEWISLRRSGTVSEARGARRLRRLQQTISEEVARYDLDAPEEVLGERTPRSSSTTRSSSTPRPVPMRRTTPTSVPAYEIEVFVGTYTHGWCSLSWDSDRADAGRLS